MVGFVCTPILPSENGDGRTEGRGLFWHPKAAAKRVASTAMRKREFAQSGFLGKVDHNCKAQATNKQKWIRFILDPPSLKQAEENAF